MSQEKPTSLTKSASVAALSVLQNYMGILKDPTQRLKNFISYFEAGLKRPGRQAGSGMLNDEDAVSRIEILMESGVKPGPAIETVLDELDPDAVSRDSDARRLRRKIKDRQAERRKNS